jgi:hypothetical protein
MLTTWYPLSAQVGNRFADKRGRSVGIVRSRTQTMEFSLRFSNFYCGNSGVLIFLAVWMRTMFSFFSVRLILHSHALKAVRNFLHVADLMLVLVVFNELILHSVGHSHKSRHWYKISLTYQYFNVIVLILISPTVHSTKKLNFTGSLITCELVIKQTTLRRVVESNNILTSSFKHLAFLNKLINFATDWKLLVCNTVLKFYIFEQWLHLYFNTLQNTQEQKP